MPRFVYNLYIMIDLRELRKYFLRPYLFDGGLAVDCTMGNGHDTEFLSKSVGESGHVWAFDIQKSALDSTAKRLSDEGCPENYTLILDSHANLPDHVKQPVNAVVFNLGYLPGSGNKALTTMRESTLAAFNASLTLVEGGGIVFVAIYPGHEEGRLEGEMLQARVAELDRRVWCATVLRILNSPESPYFIICEHK